MLKSPGPQEKEKKGCLKSHRFLGSPLWGKRKIAQNGQTEPEGVQGYSER